MVFGNVWNERENMRFIKDRMFRLEIIIFLSNTINKNPHFPQSLNLWNHGFYIYNNKLLVLNKLNKYELYYIINI